MNNNKKTSIKIQTLPSSETYNLINERNTYEELHVMLGEHLIRQY